MNLKMVLLSEINQPKGGVAKELRVGGLPSAQGNSGEQGINSVIISLSSLWSWFHTYTPKPIKENAFKYKQFTIMSITPQ